MRKTDFNNLLFFKLQTLTCFLQLSTLSNSNGNLRSPSQMSTRSINNNSNTHFKIVKSWCFCFVSFFGLFGFWYLFSWLAKTKRQFYWHRREIFNEGNRVKSVKCNTSSISYLQKVENLLISKSSIIYPLGFPAFPFAGGRELSIAYTAHKNSRCNFIPC